MEMGTLLHQQVAVQATPPRRMKPEIPAMLEEITLKLLYKEPELRYQSARGLLYDLERYENGEERFLIGEKDQKRKLTYQTRLVGREQEFTKIKEFLHKAKGIGRG